MHSMYIIILQYYKHHLRKTTIQRSQTANERGKWGKVKKKKSSSFALLTHSHGAFHFPFFFFFFFFLPPALTFLSCHLLQYPLFSFTFSPTFSCFPVLRISQNCSHHHLHSQDIWRSSRFLEFVWQHPAPLLDLKLS